MLFIDLRQLHGLIDGQDILASSTSMIGACTSQGPCRKNMYFMAKHVRETLAIGVRVRVRVKK